jgi:hypothetical protein
MQNDRCVCGFNLVVNIVPLLLVAKHNTFQYISFLVFCEHFVIVIQQSVDSGVSTGLLFTGKYSALCGGRLSVRSCPWVST